MRSLRGVVLGVVGASVLGCTGWMASPEARNNARACQEWVDHMNGLDCMAVSYDASEMCQGADASPADMATYFDCARQNARCDGDTLVNDLTSCRQPTM